MEVETTTNRLPLIYTSYSRSDTTDRTSGSSLLPSMVTSHGGKLSLRPSRPAWISLPNGVGPIGPRRRRRHDLCLSDLK